MGIAIPKQVAEQPLECNTVSSFPPWLPLRFLLSSNTLASLNDRLYPVRGSKPFFTQVAFGHDIISQQKKTNKTRSGTKKVP